MDLRGASTSDYWSDRAVVGLSTGALHDNRGDWRRLVAKAQAASDDAIELAAISEPELHALIDVFSDDGLPDVGAISVHAPIKHRTSSEVDLVDLLRGIPPRVDRLVVHPDQIEDPLSYQSLGPRLVIENMDPRKSTGRTFAELAPIFAELPDAGFCLDLAHARAVDPTMDEAWRMFEGFRERLRQLHVSSLSADGRHVPLSDSDRVLFEPILDQCRDVPWLLESVVPGLEH